MNLTIFINRILEKRIAKMNFLSSLRNIWIFIPGYFCTRFDAISATYFPWNLAPANSLSLGHLFPSLPAIVDEPYGEQPVTSSVRCCSSNEQGNPAMIIP